MKTINLNGHWQCQIAPLKGTIDNIASILKNDNWFDATVPNDIQHSLISTGLMREPVTHLNCDQESFVEKQSYWLSKGFFVDAETLANCPVIELVLDGLDANASVFINGNHIGDHPSAFRPFACDIKEFLSHGDNSIVVRLTNGLESYSIENCETIGGIIQPALEHEAGDKRRVFVRKPQYSWGWDWIPRIPTVGITGKTKLRFFDISAIRDIRVLPLHRNDKVFLRFEITVESFEIFRCEYYSLDLEIFSPKGEPVETINFKGLLQTGLNFLTHEIEIKNPQLWWPVQLGSQDRYRISAKLFWQNKLVDESSFDYGIRFVELDTNNKFAFKINGRSIFSKGANWVPSDPLYGRITDERIEKLILEAKHANFNMLRVWGGGLYEPDIFYEICDREGILVWQEFMFACAPYPDHIEAFCDEIGKEADYQTRRLRNHASVICFCGGNETVCFQKPEEPIKTTKGSVIWGKILPQAIHKNCPEIPYWYSSPYGIGDNYSCKDTPHVGDCHFWHDATMHPDMNTKISPEVYDQCQAMFVSEFGFPGPCSKESTQQYLGTNEINLNDPAWIRHKNPFANSIIEAGILKYYKDGTLSADDYLLYGGILQGFIYEYALDSLRIAERNSGALFWMFADCWGEVGWTIIDYYLRRKISWYAVRRAFSPIRLALRKNAANPLSLDVFCSNDTVTPLHGTLEYGFVSFDGTCLDIRQTQITGDQYNRNICNFELGKYSLIDGLWIARIINRPDIWPVAFKNLFPKDIPISNVPPDFTLARLNDCEYILSISSKTYIPILQIMLRKPAVVSDNFIEIIPHHKYEININSQVALNKTDVQLRNIMAYPSFCTSRNESITDTRTQHSGCDANDDDYNPAEMRNLTSARWTDLPA